MTNLKILAILDKVMSRERPHNRTGKKEYFESEEQTNPRQTKLVLGLPKYFKNYSKESENLGSQLKTPIIIKRRV